MKVVDILERAPGPPLSYEIIPPVRGGSFDQVMALVEALMPYRPAFIDVTSHAAEAVYDERPDGTLRRVVKRKRPGTLGLCAAIRYRFGVETVPHLLCKGFTREETEDALIELHYLGIRNVMALQGDDHGVAKIERPDRTRNGHAIDLVEQIAAMNRGRYLEVLDDAAATDFCVGVAGYPERHYEAPNPHWDVAHLARKVAAGADYVVTQMFFDNARYFDFVSRCRAAGVTVPIVPGLKIATSKAHLSSLPRAFHVELPEPLAGELASASSERAVDIGVDWAVNQVRGLVAGGAPGIHFYILQSSRVITRVVEALRTEGLAGG
ncbi:methylenetetrahydrofolate reductase [Haliangium sp.]|uniref:methylenetetrahydrofolate reductase n=1 Tax=Haliangium sp. TaxID=2663208 RepID=UPI003D0C4E17